MKEREKARNIPQKVIAVRRCIEGRGEHEGHPSALHTWKGERRKKEEERKKKKEIKNHISIQLANMPCIPE